MATSKKYTPGSDVPSDEIFDFPFLVDAKTSQFILNHGRIMFIVRGPPGTGKNSLKEMIKNEFPDGVICTADDFFSKTFSSAKRTKDSLKQSHEYCHKRVEQNCKKGVHPIIVSNTHMKKFEFQVYLDFAAEYGYTVVMASTLDKFHATPEILAKSNTKGLTKEYFERRLQQWQDVYPILTGWFLSTNDSLYLLKQLQSAIDILLEDGKFCRVFNAYDKDELFKMYKAKDVIFCIAGYSKSSPFELNKYCKSIKVKESFGKCFQILLKAFIITESDILAVAEIDNDYLKHPIFKSKSVERSNDEHDIDDDTNDIVSGLQAMSIQSSYKFKTIPLKNDFSNEIIDGVLEDSKSLNLNKCSCIHLAQKGDKPFSGNEIMKLFRDCLSSCINTSECLPLESFSDLNDGFKMLRLPKDRWMIKPSNDISFTTIFAGLYI